MSEESKYHQSKSQLEAEAKAIEAAKKDPKAFEVIYNKYYEQIFRYLYQRMDSMQDAADVASEVFLKALTTLDRYEFKGVPFSAWLYRVAYNELNQAFRNKKAQRTINIDMTKADVMINEMEEEYKEELKPLLKTAISNLSESDLTIVEMRFFEQRRFKEIAEILDITENNAKVRLYRVVQKLKDMITVKKDRYERI